MTKLAVELQAVETIGWHRIVQFGAKHHFLLSLDEGQIGLDDGR